MNRFVVALASLSLALIACRGGGDDGNNTGDDAGPGSGSDGSIVAGTVTIKQVQNDAMASGTQIELKGVIVTAVDTYGAKTGDIYVEDADGGAFSGVKVFGAPLDAVATLAVGDKIDITNAQKNEFACTVAICGFAFPAGASVTEVESVNGGDLSVVKSGTGTVPAPAVVDALAISMMTDATARDAEWEKWEGVYIKVINARQTNVVKGFGAMAADQKSFGITSGASVESVLAPFSTDAVAGTCFSGITGIGDYFGGYLVLPTDMASTTGGGTGCAPLTQATIPQIQAGTATGSVQLTDVYVSAVSANKKNYWVSQSLTAAANQGVYVFRCSLGTAGTGCDSTSALDASITPGAKVSLIADVVEFNNSTGTGTLTELKGPSITAMTASAASPTPVTGQLVAPLLVDATGEPYESVLVTLTNVKVTANAAGTADLAQFPANTAFKATPDIFVLPDAVGTCYASISGIWNYDFFNDRFAFLPSAAGTTGGTCN
ncbi:MAG TPA: hypothetical protein VGM90_03705 [Kofleriaceae bacterium]|jgi:hypothetical protein